MRANARMILARAARPTPGAHVAEPAHVRAANGGDDQLVRQRLPIEDEGAFLREASVRNGQVSALMEGIYGMQCHAWFYE